MKKFSLLPNPGHTRLCLDPWAKVFIRANGDICLCCNSPPIGSINNTEIEAIINNDKANNYRDGLLSGNLQLACQSCPDRKSVLLSELVAIVHEYIKNDNMNVF